MSGKLTAKRSSGTLSAIAKIADKATGAEVTSCQTGTLNWVAARATRASSTAARPRRASRSCCASPPTAHRVNDVHHDLAGAVR